MDINTFLLIFIFIMVSYTACAVHFEVESIHRSIKDLHKGEVSNY